jgi:ABC-type polysaccharide/polyol phosphate transport system ATPase subunit
MTSAVIHGESLGKRYRRGLHVETGLRHTIENFIRSPFSVFRGNGQESFWALKDVSLEVCQGEVLGLIGRNGAGKTTLLKILSRITRPTTGWAEIHGRVGSLLEVGTGFHPELTGRENTFLSGAILGMSKREIERKFDEIVAFAELDKFIDTQVKHYSSGMYVRLAFAVAAHLEPEILLVDEVLAVGDLKFQKKCLGKMGDVARAGRTVVLVSHQLNQIRRLCQRVLWIDGGELRKSGPTHEVVSAYESLMNSVDDVSAKDPGRTNYKARFTGWAITYPAGAAPHALSTLGPVTVKFFLHVREPVQRGIHGITLYTADRQIVWGWAAYDLNFSHGVHELSYEFPTLPVKPGAYTWMLSLWDDHGQIDMGDAIPEMLVATESHQHPLDEWSGLLNIPVQFSIRVRQALHSVKGE